MNEMTGDQFPTRIEAGSSTEPFIRRLVIVLLLLGGAVWVFIDHYVMGNYRPEQDYHKYLLNHYIPYVLVPLGLAMLIWTLIRQGRRLVADGTGIGYAGKPQIAWDRITQVDARVLASKGLLTLHCGQDDEELKLDSYLLRNFRDVVAFIERHVPAEKIVR